MEHINIMRDIMQKEKAREQACKDFTGLYSSHITRPGAAELLAWLKTTDFFKAPAGAKHHGAYPGGLVRHSLNVYYQLLGDYSIRGMEHEAETTAICGLLHDVCKVGVYHEANPFDAALEGKTEPYIFSDPFPLGHGEKSVYLISRFIRLTDEEALAIRWHMGPYDKAAKGGGRDLDDAMAISPLVYALHAADMRAAQEEKRKEAAGNDC